MLVTPSAKKRSVLK